MLRKKLSLFSVFCIAIFGSCHGTTEQTLNKLNSYGTEFVSFVFTDLHGNLREVEFPMQHIPSIFKSGGIYFDGSSVPGYSTITESDMFLKPRLSTTKFLPWTKAKKAQILCAVSKTKNKPYQGDSPAILNTVIHEAEQMGYKFFVGAELEFTLFVKDNGKLKPFDSSGYFAADTNLQWLDIKHEIIKNLLDLGIKIEKFHHEVAPGQYEIVFKYSDPITLADNIVITKNTLTLLLGSKNIIVSFLPKPTPNQNGNGMHIHYSLFDIHKNKNAFYDEKMPAQLSSLARSFIAGNLIFLPEITPLLNPISNSFQRLVPGYEAPIYVCCGEKNRTTAIRIPESHEPSSVRAELRTADPSCNPYLAFAALLKTGLEGIKNNAQLPMLVQENLYQLNQEEINQKGILALPCSLQDALLRMQNSSLVTELLGSSLKNEFILLKSKNI